MMIPSTKQIILFFILNFLLMAFFNILLFKMPAFITHESFNTFLILNSKKIGMLVSVFILTSFILNLLFFCNFIKNDIKRSLLSTVKMSVRTFLAGIIWAMVVIVINEIK